MPEPAPTNDEWRQLYQAATRLKEVAPWEWMEETDVFGVQNPETKDLGFASVMGQLGEHLAVAVYLGAEGLYRFWAFEKVAPTAPPEALLELPHLQASFEDRSALSDRDRAVIKELGLKFRGRQAWPLFRSYRPGFFPWYLEAPEARFLRHVLEQTMDVAPRFKEDPALLATPDENSYLVRVPREEGGALAWEDRVVAVPPPEPETIPIRLDAKVLEQVRRLSRTLQALEVDLYMLQTLVGERGARPYTPYMLLVVDSASGFILGSELLTADPNLSAMLGSIPLRLLAVIARFGALPGEIRVRSPLLLQLLQPVAERVGVEVVRTRAMPSLAAARRSLTRMFP